MTALQTKDWLLQVVEQADDLLLYRLATVVRRAQRTDEEMAESIRQYEASMVPMTQEEVARRLAKSEEDIAAGRVYTIDQVKKMLGR